MRHWSFLVGILGLFPLLGLGVPVDFAGGCQWTLDSIMMIGCYYPSRLVYTAGRRRGVMAGRPFNLVPLMGTLRGYSSFNIRTHYYFEKSRIYFEQPGP